MVNRAIGVVMPDFDENDLHENGKGIPWSSVQIVISGPELVVRQSPRPSQSTRSGMHVADFAGCLLMELETET